MGNKKWLVIGLIVLVVLGIVLYLKKENDTANNIQEIEKDRREGEKRLKQIEYDSELEQKKLELKESEKELKEAEERHKAWKEKHTN